MRKHFILLTALFLACACEKEFDPAYRNQEAMLRLVCNPGTSDTTVIFLSGASPVSKDTVIYDLSGALVTLTVDGASREVKYSDGTLDGLPSEACWYSVGKIAPGEKVVVSAEDAAIGKVSSETVVPQAIRISSVTTSHTEGSEYTYFDIKVDGVETGGYYAFSIYAESTFTTCSYSYIINDGVPDPDSATEHWEENTYCSTLSPVDDNSESNLGMDVSDYITVPYDGWKFTTGWGKDNMTLLRGKDFTDNGGTVRIMTGLMSGTSEYKATNEWGYPSYYSKGTVRYKVRFYHLTPECYRYAKSRYELYNNGLAEMGFAPSTYTYTNVSGGAGAVAALVLSETGWRDAL